MLKPSSALPPADTTDPAVIPKDSSPTWELEMLVSGGVIYSLFQLPPLLDRLVARWEPHATHDAAIVLVMSYAYSKAVLYTLIVAFVVHLGTRAYWVGLVGLNSVFAGGIKWDAAKLGPIAREVYRERLPTLPRIIARLDNFASIIFSFAFLVVMVTMLSIAIVAVAAGLAYLLSAQLFGGQHVGRIALGLLLLFSVPSMLVSLVDKRVGARLAPESRLRRLLLRLYRAYYRLSFFSAFGPILLTISTNGRRRTTYVLFYVALIGSVYFVIGEWLVRRSVISVNSADYFSTRSSANTVDYGFYESAWPADQMNASAPSIQSDVIREPYVRLFIPYQPDRHNAAMAEQCTGLPPLERRGAFLTRRSGNAASDSAAVKALGCLGAMHAVTINGVPIRERFRFSSHPLTGVDGIVAYLSADEMIRGENVLTVTPAPRRPEVRAKRPPQEPWVIPFWR